MTHACSEQESLDSNSSPHHQSILSYAQQPFVYGGNNQIGGHIDPIKQWLADHTNLLVSKFLVDISAYTATSNHSQPVIRISLNSAGLQSDDKVICR